MIGFSLNLFSHVCVILQTCVCFRITTNFHFLTTFFAYAIHSKTHKISFFDNGNLQILDAYVDNEVEKRRRTTVYWQNAGEIV